MMMSFRFLLRLVPLCFLFLFLACGKSSESAQMSPYEVSGDHALGNPNASVTLVEYASITCSHCAVFHKTIWPQIKKEYVDTGKIRYIFREFPTPPQQLATAGFLIANCAGEDKFFSILDTFFDRQVAIFKEAEQGRAREALLAIAKQFGLSEDKVNQCFANKEEIKHLQDVQIKGYETYKITGTPSFLINGTLVPYEKTRNFEDFKAQFDALLNSTSQ